jgi:hypothetical protein
VAFSWLLRWKQRTAASATSSFNKVLTVGCFFFDSGSAASSFPLAGLGGEDREVEVLVRCGGKGNGSFSAPVLVRGAEWRLASSSSASLLLLACRGGDGNKESSRRQAAGSLFFKRGGSSAACVATVLVCLVGRGSEEMGKTGSMVLLSVLCLWGTLENSPLW